MKYPWPFYSVIICFKLKDLKKIELLAKQTEYRCITALRELYRKLGILNNNNYFL